MSFIKLIEFSDKKIREEIGDYYIISKDRIENIRNNFDRLREDKQKLKDILRELAEAAEEKDSFIYFEEPGLPGSKERDDFKDAKYRAWERYQDALEAAKEKMQLGWRRKSDETKITHKMNLEALK